MFNNGLKHKIKTLDRIKQTKHWYISTINLFHKKSANYTALHLLFVILK